MPQIMPMVPSVPFYRLATAVDSTAYLIDVRWNERDAAWYLDFYEEDETPIAMGVKVVLGAYLGRSFQHPLFRDGVFVAVDTSGQRLDATLDDLGTRVHIRRYQIPEIFGGDPQAIQ